MSGGGEEFGYLPVRHLGTRWEFPFVSRAPGDDVAFTEVIEFTDLPGAGGDLDVPTSSVVVQLLHAALGLSYYKARPAPIVLDFPADPRVAPFLRELIAHGLAEFAYTSGRRDALTPPVTVAVERAADEGPARPAVDGVLVPLGGGKDSVVTVDLLQRAGTAVQAFAVGAHPTIRACAEAAGVPLRVASRTLDPGLAAFTARTGLNGHIPVTAINSLVALLFARARGIGAVVMSNEGSADEATLESDGLVVNHQWSKSTAFERLLRSVLPDGLGYFSLLRPWQEIQIARRFAEIGSFDTVAISCNNVYLRDASRRAPSWCLRCPKCAFVGLVLAPFLPPERRTRMFGGDVVGSEAMSENLRSLVGLTSGKPLECVGEVLESRAALLLLARTGEALPDFVDDVRRELESRALMPTGDQIDLLFRSDPAAVAELPEPYRHVLDPVVTRPALR